MNVELLHEPGAVGFGGLDGDEQERGNIASGLALGDQLQDLTFTKREGIRLATERKSLYNRQPAGTFRRSLSKGLICLRWFFLICLTAITRNIPRLWGSEGAPPP